MFYGFSAGPTSTRSTKTSSTTGYGKSTVGGRPVPWRLGEDKDVAMGG